MIIGGAGVKLIELCAINKTNRNQGALCHPGDLITRKRLFLAVRLNGE